MHAHPVTPQTETDVLKFAFFLFTCHLRSVLSAGVGGGVILCVVVCGAVFLSCRVLFLLCVCVCGLFLFL